MMKVSPNGRKPSRTPGFHPKIGRHLRGEIVAAGEDALLVCQELSKSAGALIRDNQKLMRLNRKIVRNLARAKKARTPPCEA